MRGIADWIKKRKKPVIAAALILLTVSTVALNMLRNRGEEPVPVQAAAAEMKEIEDSVFATGRVQLVAKQEVYSASPSRVKKIFVKPGDKVVKGQLLILLDDDNVDAGLSEAAADLQVQEANYAKALAERPMDIEGLKAEVDRAASAVEAARAKFERYKALYGEGAVSAEEYDKAELEYKNSDADYRKAQASLAAKQSGSVFENEIKALEAQVNSARARYDQARKEYDRVNIKSELDGIVYSVEVSEGDAVDGSKRLLTVGEPDRLEVKAGINEGDSGKLMVGQKAELKIAALPGARYSGTVIQVSPGAVETGNDRGGTSMEIPVVIAVEGDMSGLRPGYTADVTIITTQRKTSLVVPYEAVLERDGKAYAYVIENGKAVERQIRTGLNTELYTEVLEGLAEGDRVIIKPGREIKDGLGVREVPATGASQVVIQ